MINRVVMTGRLTTTPELKQTASGVSVTNFTIAQNKANDKVDFFRFKAWEGNAEFICKYFRKGDGIELEGHLTTSKYEKDGIEHTAYEVICDRVGFPLGKREVPGESGQAMASAVVPNYTGTPAPNFETVEDDEDLPF